MAGTSAWPQWRDALSLRLPVQLVVRVPLRLRIFFRGAFALLALATLALALSVLQGEKQRSHRRYADGLNASLAQVAARLRHPTGQMALLNPDAAARPATPPVPWVLPFGALDFDDRNKAQQAVEMAGCGLQYADGATLCVGLGNNPYAGGYVYLVGSLLAPALVAHTPGDLALDGAHRAVVRLRYRDQASHWVAPYELTPDGRGRLTAFDGDRPVTPDSRPLRDFRGWLWQEPRCAEATADPAGNCPRRSFFSIRLPVEAFREALSARNPPWPPADLAQLAVRLQLLPPGDGAPLFDSQRPGAQQAFAWSELRGLLQPGERLTVQREGAAAPLLTLTGAEGTGEPIAPWVSQLIRRLPVDGFDAPVQARDSIATPLGRYRLQLDGDIRSVNQGLAAVATRLSGFVAAMLLAVLLTWLAIEVRIIRRVTLLTRRAAAVSTGIRSSATDPAAAAAALAGLDGPDLRGSDELGVLAQGLRDLLRRVNDDVQREQIRARQEQDMWHAVGHEIMSPLQSLMALHGAPDDASRRYILRMQQAVKVLYGQASPSEAFETTTLALQPLDLDAFLASVAANATYIGIADVAYDGPGRAVPVHADEHSLEDVVGHVLRNADRHRLSGTPIRLSLTLQPQQVLVAVHNQGEGIDPAQLERIFEYGVSGAAAVAGAEAGTDEAAASHRGQGLFVARTYMAKMGGTITAHNVGGGVEFRLTLPRPPEVVR